ncbi:MAG: glycosyl hydrolase-related protein, partial [Leptolyngbyaceae bacterium]|nr:glycosyl hydrolase-related protein [Leptolyngbyaceae bacterium]
GANGHLPLQLPTHGRFLNLPQENLFLTAFKRSEEQMNRWMLRFYEGHGEPTELNTDTFFPTVQDAGVNLTAEEWTSILEEVLPQGEEDLSEGEFGGALAYQGVERIAPWKIKTIAFRAKM